MNEPQAGPKGSLDLTKPVQTRDGRAVRLLCTDATPDYPIVGVVATSIGKGPPFIQCWEEGGGLPNDGRECAGDLVNVPPPEKHSWLNVYLDIFVGPYLGGMGETEEEVPTRAGCGAATLKITRVGGVVTKVELV